MKNSRLGKRTLAIIISAVVVLNIAVGVIIAINLKNNPNGASSEDTSSKISQSQSGSNTFDAASNKSESGKGDNNSSSGTSKVESSSKVQAASKNEGTSQKEENEILRPEKIKKVFAFDNLFAKAEPIKETFYDSQNGNTLPYSLFLPQNYDKNKSYPVILFLHGAGEMGTDNKRHLYNLENLFLYNGDLINRAILLCPQTVEWWYLDREYEGDQKGTLGSALHLLQEIQKRYSCDNNRIYVMGLSMGGFATWSLLEEYGSIFAAGIPICGGGNSSKGAALKDIPIRIYHGINDYTVHYSASENMYDAIVSAGGKKVKFISLPNVGHNAWDHAFSDRDTFSWLFAQNKSTNPSGEYDYIHYFKVTDSKGNKIISDRDILEIRCETEHGNDDIVHTVNLLLYPSSMQKLKKAYGASKGSPFTVYWSTEKLYTFTAVKQPIDDMFSIRDVFGSTTYLSFYNVINKVVN